MFKVTPYDICYERMFQDLPMSYKGLLFGQFCAVLLAFATFSSAKLSDYNFTFPALQNSIVYTFMFIFGLVAEFLSTRSHARSKPVKSTGKKAPLSDQEQHPQPHQEQLSQDEGWVLKWKVLITAGLDFSANYFAVFALLKTQASPISIQIMLAATCPFVVILSRIFLRRYFKLMSLIGVMISICGLSLIIYCDYLQSPLKGKSKSKFSANTGDALALVAALCYAACNCFEEWILNTNSHSHDFEDASVKTGGRTRGRTGPMTGAHDDSEIVDDAIIETSEKSSSDIYSTLKWMGLFGGLLGFTVFGLFEFPEMSSLGQSKRLLDSNVIIWLSAFSISMLVFYISLFGFLSKFDAALFNLSTLTSGVYLALFMTLTNSALPFKYWFYILGFVLALSGAALHYNTQYTLNGQGDVGGEKIPDDERDVDDKVTVSMF